MIVIGNGNEFLLDFALFLNPVQRVLNNITFHFYFDEENSICFGYVVLSDNKVTGWAQYHKQPICCFFFHNTPGCDIARHRWMEVGFFWKTPFVTFLKQLKQVIQGVSEESLFGSLWIFFSIRNPGLYL